jgi:hypothetical protein
MSYITCELEPIILSTSPNYGIIYCEDKHYKLYEHRFHDSIVEIYGTFLHSDNCAIKENNTSYMNVRKLFIRIDKKSFSINVATLELENIIGNLKNNITTTSIKKIGGTLCRDFFIDEIKYTTINIIKNINSSNNIVEIMSYTNFNTNHSLEYKSSNVQSSPIRIPACNY